MPQYKTTTVGLDKREIPILDSTVGGSGGDVRTLEDEPLTFPTLILCDMHAASFSLLDGYLIAYNAGSAMAWWWCTFRVLQNFKSLETSYKDFGAVVLWTQSLAVLEIFHSLFRIVKSPLLTTVMQVSSRLVLVWLVCLPFPTVPQHLYYTTMVTAWGITEVIRYSYYALHILGLDGDHFWFLVWCRYHFFYVLYPIGAGSELLLINRAIPLAKKLEDPTLYYLLTAISFTYPPGFYMMYTHMMKQRAKFIKSGILEAKERAEVAAASEGKKGK
ncbi:hypothetical protein HDU67_001186 [Dinochytrium kinnereticum]|nr:hypothetical protein HDU67_001186 [Dinochytrium kinnereticum]